MGIQDKELTRKEFLAGAGLLVVGFSFLGSVVSSLPAAAAGTASAAAGAASAAATTAPVILPGDIKATPTVDSWLSIDSNGGVNIFTGKVRLGQGIGIAFEQIVADELDIDLSQVASITFGTTGVTPDEGYTAGSTSVMIGGMSLRYAAAAARQYLIGLAATQWNVDPSSLTVSGGVISGGPKGATVSYGALIGGQKLNVIVNPADPPPLKNPADYEYVGKPLPRLAIPAIMTASEPYYLQNIRLPAMLHGRVLRPPSPNAQLLSLPTAAASQIEGVVKVVKNGSFVGVVAETEWAAIQAVSALRETATWGQTNEFPPMADIDTYLRSALHEDVREIDTYNVEATMKTAATHVKADYSVPYLAHASMGPSCSIAWLHNGDQWTIYDGTQGPVPDQGSLAALVGASPANVQVIAAPASGAYGHNGADDVNADAMLLAQAVPGRPVRVQWMRADEFQWEPYGSAMSFRLEGGLDTNGNIVAWNHDIWTGTYSTRPNGGPGWLLAGWYMDNPQPMPPPAMVGGDRNAIPYYTLGSIRVYCHYIENSPLRVSAHRTLGAFRNIFAIESFMDELAAAAKADPAAFRLNYLTDPRAIAVINAATQAANWKSGAGPTGQGRGIAFTRYENTAAYVATVAEVAVDKGTGQITVKHLYTAYDLGQIINANGAQNQAEGGAIQATSWTLKEQVTWNNQSIESVDWLTYPILTFPEVPLVTTIPIDHPDISPVGFGEAAAVPVGAAIANAVFDLTGVRLRNLPLTPDKVKAALSA